MAVGEFLTWAVQAQSAPAHVGRLLQSVLLNEGVVDVAGNSFKVAQDTGSNMQVKIGSGTLGDLAAVAGDDVAGQGIYVIEAQNATVTRVVAASDPSNPRIDRVVLQNYDNEADSSGLNDADVEIIQGTPAGSPSAPALPASAISLATIAVGAGVTAIVDANITDTRAEASLRPALVDPSVGQWQDWVPTYANLTVGNGTVVARYTQVGKLVQARFEFTMGSTSAMGPAPTVSLPVTAVTHQLNFPVGTGKVTDAATADFLLHIWLPSTTTFKPLVVTAGGTFAQYADVSSTAPMTWVTGDYFTFAATYEAA